MCKKAFKLEEKVNQSRESIETLPVRYEVCTIIRKQFPFVSTNLFGLLDELRDC
jgi:hypothetical protein